MKSGSFNKTVLILSIVFFGLGNSSQAQWFADPIINPFGLDSLGINITIAFGDLDNDEDNDLMVRSDLWNDSLDIYSRNFYYFENIGNAAIPLFAEAVENPFGLDSTDIDIYFSGNGIDFGDLDNDGDLELICGFTILENSGNSNSPFFINSDEFIIDNSEWGEFYGCANGLYPRLEDMDNDNDLDLLWNLCTPMSESSYNSGILYTKNIGNESEFLLDTLYYYITGHPWVDAFQIAASDLDLDEDIDILLIGHNGVPSGYVENTGTSDSLYNDTFLYAPFFGLDIDFFNGSPDFNDLDNDGDQDLLIGLEDGNFLYFMHDVSLGITELKEIEISMYPNPVKNVLIIETEFEIESVEIIDILGNVSLQSMRSTNQLNVSELNTGLYLIKIHFKNGEIGIKKIVKE